MATNRAHAGQRLSVVFSVAHAAGDLVWEGGFYGVTQDAVAAGALGVLILGDVWTLGRAPSTVKMGQILSAPATAQATTLPLLAAGATLGSVPTAGWFPVGKTVATGGATQAKVQMFNPSPFQSS
jgi:predicted RecA/RadA family phage recombinase